MTRLTRMPSLAKTRDGGLKKGDGALLALVGPDLNESDARGIVAWTNSQPRQYGG